MVIEPTILDLCQEDVKSGQQRLDEWSCSRSLLHQPPQRRASISQFISTPAAVLLWLTRAAHAIKRSGQMPKASRDAPMEKGNK